MNTPKTCPLSLSVQPPPMVRLAGQPTTTAVNGAHCIGVQCMLWMTEQGNPTVGDCAFRIQAVAASHSAHLLNQMFNSAADEDDRA